MEKRKSENQLTKDSVPSEEAEEITHGFEKASEDVLKTRKICKVKRGGVSGTHAPTNSNPFAGIALKATQQTKASVDTGKEKVVEAEKSSIGGFGGLAKGGGGFGVLAFGKGSGDATTGLAFGARGAKPTNGEEGKQPQAVLPVFGSTKSSQAQSSEEAVTTGEEDEDTLYSCMASLYEFDNGQWKEKGRGRLKLNKHKEKGTIRLIMRQQGNLKLMLNAHVWDGMKINKMEESKGISFSCMNHLTDDSTDTLTMFAVRTREATSIQGLCEAIDLHKKDSC